MSTKAKGEDGGVENPKILSTCFMDGPKKMTENISVCARVKIPNFYISREQVFFKIAFRSIVRVASWFSMMLCIKLNKKEAFVFCTTTEKFKEKLYFSWFFAPIISLHYSCDLRFYTQ